MTLSIGSADDGHRRVGEAERMIRTSTRVLDKLETLEKRGEGRLSKSVIRCLRMQGVGRIQATSMRCNERDMLNRVARSTVSLRPRAVVQVCMG